MKNDLYSVIRGKQLPSRAHAHPLGHTDRNTEVPKLGHGIPIKSVKKWRRLNTSSGVETWAQSPMWPWLGTSYLFLYLCFFICKIKIVRVPTTLDQGRGLYILTYIRNLKSYLVPSQAFYKDLLTNEWFNYSRFLLRETPIAFGSTVVNLHLWAYFINST